MGDPITPPVSSYNRYVDRTVRVKSFFLLYRYRIDIKLFGQYNI